MSRTCRIELLEPSTGAVVRSIKRLQNGLLLADLVLHDHDVVLELRGRDARDDPGQIAHPVAGSHAGVHPGANTHDGAALGGRGGHEGLQST